MSPSLDSMLLQVSPGTVLCLWLHVASLSPTQTTEPGKGVRISHSASGLSLAYVVLLMLAKALHRRYEQPLSSQRLSGLLRTHCCSAFHHRAAFKEPVHACMCGCKDRATAC